LRLEEGDFDFIPPVWMSAAEHLKDLREPKLGWSLGYGHVSRAEHFPSIAATALR